MTLCLQNGLGFSPALLFTPGNVGSTVWHLTGLDSMAMTLFLPIFVSATVALEPRDGVPMYSELSLAKQSDEKMHLLQLGFHQDTER